MSAAEDGGVSPSTARSALALARTGTVIDLGHPLRASTSHYPTHVGFELELTRRHGDGFRGDGSSSASCTFRMGSHTGTHIDALGHVSDGGMLFDGTDAREASRPDGLATGGAQEQQPLVVPGVLLDIAGLHGVDALPADHIVIADELRAALDRHGLELVPDTAALIRTGWDRHWETDEYLGPEAPGPDLKAARWLGDHGVSVVGSDTAVFEKGPVKDAAPVHTELLIRRRIPIIENLHLTPLLAANLVRFAFVCVPLAIEGGTASPIRPLAIG